MRGHAHGPDGCVLTHVDAGHDGCVVSKPCVGADFCLAVFNQRTVNRIVCVRVDSYKIRDGRAFFDDDFAAVIKDRVTMNHAVVFNGEVVAEGELDAVKDFYIFADVLEDVLAQHGTKTKAEPVVQADRRAVKHLPEIDKRLDGGVLFHVDVAVILALKRGVFGVKRQLQHVVGQLAVEVKVEPPPFRRAKLHLVQVIEHQLLAQGGLFVFADLAVQKFEPSLKNFLGLARRFQLSVAITGHAWVRLLVVRFPLVLMRRDSGGRRGELWRRVTGGKRQRKLSRSGEP